MESISLISQEEDQSRTTQILNESPLPPEIFDVAMDFKNDSSGEPSIYLSFQVKPGVVLDKESIARISRYMSGVLDRLLRSGISRFPYASLDEAA
jgi:hypothetical protein